MNMRKLALTVAALAVVAVPVAGATTTAAATPDQRFVSELKGARQAAQVAFRQLTPWNISIDKVAKAKSELTRALDHLKSATQAATGAVGASEAEIAGNVRTATNFIALASKDVRKGNYDAARDSVDVALEPTVLRWRSSAFRSQRSSRRRRSTASSATSRAGRSTSGSRPR